MTFERVFPTLMELNEWRSTGHFTCGGVVLVPASRADIIRRNYSSIQNQKAAAALYFIAHSPFARWSYIAKGLYLDDEKRAIETFKALLPTSIGGQCECVGDSVCISGLYTFQMKPNICSLSK